MRIKSVVLLILATACCCSWTLAAADNTDPAWQSTMHSSDSGFVGSNVCRGCHQQVWDEWRESHHHKSMMRPTEESVLGRFDGKPVQFGGIRSRMYKSEGSYLVETEMGQGEKAETFAVAYTFGFYPLQQYLLETEQGRLQAFNLAWDSRPQAEGGERWINLQTDPDVKPGSPFFWTGHFFNWNTQCADCHSTGVNLGYVPPTPTGQAGNDEQKISNSERDGGKGEFHTSFAEINVACEACHGPGKSHLLAGGKPGTLINAPQQFSWFFTEGESIARPRLMDKLAEVHHGKDASQDERNITMPGAGQYSTNTSGKQAGSNSETTSPGKAGKGTDKADGQQPGQAQAGQQEIAEATSLMINMCGGCHSRRTALHARQGKGDDSGLGYHDQHELSLLEAGLYHADGQILEEVFVLGSFLQSKMHAAGVTCTNCHNPHTGKLLLQGNSLCAQCHDMTAYNTQAHHFHPQLAKNESVDQSVNQSLGQSSGKQGKGPPGMPLCVDCHLPQQNFMLIDARADHRFGIPHTDPQSHLPSACLDCHDDMPSLPDNSRAADADMTQQDHDWAAIHAGLRALDPELLPLALALLSDSAAAKQGSAKPTETRSRSSAKQGSARPTETRSRFSAGQPLPSIQAASLVRLMPAATPMTLLREMASHTSPLVRRATALALEQQDPRSSIKLIQQLARDKVRSVRFAAARVLAGQLGRLGSSSPEKENPATRQLLDEYRQHLAASGYSPIALTDLASLETHLGRLQQARQALEQALVLEPNYLPALLNLADLHRALGGETNEMTAARLLGQAVAFAPESGAAHFALALSLVRRKRTDDALVHFAAAVEQADVTPRYYYVYAIALDSTGQTSQAISRLGEALSTWPGQANLMQLEKQLSRKSRQGQSP